MLELHLFLQWCWLPSIIWTITTISSWNRNKSRDTSLLGRLISEKCCSRFWVTHKATKSHIQIMASLIHHVRDVKTALTLPSHIVVRTGCVFLAPTWPFKVQLHKETDLHAWEDDTDQVSEPPTWIRQTLVILNYTTPTATLYHHIKYWLCKDLPWLSKTDYWNRDYSTQVWVLMVSTFSEH